MASIKSTSGSSGLARRWWNRQSAPDAARPADSADFVVFTIAANNYTPYAKTLMDSVKAQHPNSRRFIVICDEPNPSIGYDELPAEVIFSRDLGIPDHASMAFAYDVMEFATAIKPYCFLHLMQRHPAPGYIYLDPDIIVLRPLKHVSAALDAGRTMVLIPHMLKPLQDGFEPTDHTIMKAGVYNLGFLGVRADPEIDSFMHWWADRCRRDAVVDIPNHKFTDQRWMDLAPAFVSESFILRHPGYNLAYWNLLHRQVVGSDDGLLANGEPVHFVHFSGIIPHDRSVFSKHSNRYKVEDLGDLKSLFDDYLDTLIANGWPDSRKIPYAYNAFQSGRRIARTMRCSFRRHETGVGLVPTQPFEEDGAIYDTPEPALDHLGAPHITRVMYELWSLRLDLQRTFPLDQAEGRLRFLEWFVTRSPGEEGPDEASVAAAERLLALVCAGPQPADQPVVPVPAPWPAQRNSAYAGPRPGLLQWLARTLPLRFANAGAVALVPRYFALLWETRRHLQANFRNDSIAEVERFLVWCLTGGVVEGIVEVELAQQRGSSCFDSPEPLAHGNDVPFSRLMRLFHTHYRAKFTTPDFAERHCGQTLPAEPRSQQQAERTPVDALDVACLYQLCLLRAPENEAVISQNVTFLGCPEFNNNVLPRLLNASSDEPVAPMALRDLAAWAAARLPIEAATRREIETAGSLHELYVALIYDPLVADRIPGFPTERIYKAQRARAYAQGPASNSRAALALWLCGPASRRFRWPDTVIASLLRWLETPAGGAPGLMPLTNAMLSIFSLRPDIRARFDLDDSAGRHGFLKWYESVGVFEYGLDRPRQAKPLSNESATLSPALLPSICLTGYWRKAGGRPEDLRTTAATLQKAGFDFIIFDRASQLFLDAEGVRVEVPAGHIKVNIVHCNADTALDDFTAMHRAGLSDAYTVGFWAWELAQLPGCYRSAFSYYDEIWAATRFTEHAFTAERLRPVWLMPMLVHLPRELPNQSRRDFELPENGFIFYYGFDFGSYAGRKNPEAAIQAFRQAFADDDRIYLVIKSLGARDNPHLWARLMRLRNGDSRIILRDREYDYPTLIRLIELCDCFISPHRSEGFGRGPAEAMLLGKPVIATGYSGNTDFTTPETAFLVDYKLIPVQRDQYPESTGQVWADVDLDHLARLMRQVFEQPEVARRKALAGQAYMRLHYSAERVAEPFSSRISDILKEFEHGAAA
jgi:glycosyltransferase involved in cell wall biosynthesis